MTQREKNGEQKNHRNRSNRESNIHVIIFSKVHPIGDSGLYGSISCMHRLFLHMIYNRWDKPLDFYRALRRGCWRHDQAKVNACSPPSHYTAQHGVGTHVSTHHLRRSTAVNRLLLRPPTSPRGLVCLEFCGRKPASTLQSAAATRFLACTASSPRDRLAVSKT